MALHFEQSRGEDRIHLATWTWVPGTGWTPTRIEHFKASTVGATVNPGYSYEPPTTDHPLTEI